MSGNVEAIENLGLFPGVSGWETEEVGIWGWGGLKYMQLFLIWVTLGQSHTLPNLPYRVVGRKKWRRYKLLWVSIWGQKAGYK